MSEKHSEKNRKSARENASAERLRGGGDIVEAEPSSHLSGEVNVPGDKSLSHRALFLSALASGRSVIENLGEGADIGSTISVLESLGVRAQKKEGAGAGTSACWEIDGLGLGGFLPPQEILACGNSGTTARLLLGILAGHAFPSFISGDASLRARPMGRVAKPLREAGALISTAGAEEGAQSEERLPLSITGTRTLLPFEKTPTGGSAQVKTALLFAALLGVGKSALRETILSRDHTERMMPLFGVRPQISQNKKEREISLTGGEELFPAELSIAGDPSSAAFLAAAAALAPKSEIHLPNICVNPLRMGFFHAIERMGVKTEYSEKRTAYGEEWASLVIRTAASIKGVEIAAHEAPSMIDEFPILAIVAAHAKGRSHFRGLSELRIKESDRLQSVLLGLRANGVEASLQGDDLIIEGCGGAPLGGGRVESFSDHRIAMAFLVLGLTARRRVVVEGAEAAGVSFPNFLETLRGLGANLS